MTGQSSNHDRSKFKSFQIKYIKILSFHWVSSMCTLIFMNPSVLLSNTSNQHLHEDSKQNIPVPYVLRLVGLCKLRMENRRSWPTGLLIGLTGALIKHFECDLIKYFVCELIKHFKSDLIKHFECFFLVWFGDSHAILNRNDADVVGVRGGLFKKIHWFEFWNQVALLSSSVYMYVTFELYHWKWGGCVLMCSISKHLKIRLLCFPQVGAFLFLWRSYDIIFSYASSSTLYPCEWVSKWVGRVSD